MSPRIAMSLRILLAAALVASIGVLHYRLDAAQTARASAAEREFEAVTSRVHAGAEPSKADEPLSEIRVTIPDASAVSDLLSDISRTLADLGATEREMTTGETRDADGVRQVPVNVTFKGSFRSMHALLTHLRGYGYVVRVTRVTVTRETQGADALAIGVRMVMYVRAGKEAA